MYKYFENIEKKCIIIHESVIPILQTLNNIFLKIKKNKNKKKNFRSGK